MCTAGLNQGAGDSAVTAEPQVNSWASKTATCWLAPPGQVSISARSWWLPIRVWLAAAWLQRMHVEHSGNSSGSSQTKTAVRNQPGHGPMLGAHAQHAPMQISQLCKAQTHHAGWAHSGWEGSASRCCMQAACGSPMTVPPATG